MVGVCVGNLPVAISGVVLLLMAFVFLGLFGSAVAEYFGLTALCVALLWIIATGVHRFLHRKRFEGSAILALGSLGVFIAIFIYSILSAMLVMIDGDHWADDLTIPAGIDLNEPIEAAVVNADSSAFVPDILLFKGAQPGIYGYAVRVGRLKPGNIYLKAFEITEGTRLSEESLEKGSIIRVSNPAAEPLSFRSEQSFTIYEGDWGKFYAARFEVWFRPEGGGDEVMLIKKNFRIEGWMH